MSSQVRRVITGHDDQGKAIVLIDETIDLTPTPRGFAGKVLWTTEGFPVSNDGDEDAGQREVRIALPDGTIFRVVEFQPGNEAMNHRTETIDYAVVMWGEIDMEIDGDTVHFKAGDTLVQRGTIHNWVNRGTDPCAIAFVLVDAEPVTIDGRPLGEAGVHSPQPSADH